MVDVTSTRVLLEQYHAGDSEALNTLYGRYTTCVLAVVRARLGAELRQKVQSWDIVQEAMLASFQDIQKFEYASEGAFLKWLTTIVENMRDGSHSATAKNDPKVPGADEVVDAGQALEKLEALFTMLRDSSDVVPSGPSPGDSNSVSQRFRILHRHASGGLGDIWIAHDEELNRKVALKEIQPQFAGHAQSRSRFLREAVKPS